MVIEYVELTIFICWKYIIQNPSFHPLLARIVGLRDKLSLQAQFFLFSFFYILIET